MPAMTQLPSQQQYDALEDGDQLGRKRLVRTFQIDVKLADRGTTVVDFQSLLDKARSELVAASHPQRARKLKKKRKRRQSIIVDSESDSDKSEEDIDDDDDDDDEEEDEEVEIGEVGSFEADENVGGDGEDGLKELKRLKKRRDVEEQSSDVDVDDEEGEAGISEDDMRDFIVSDEDEDDDDEGIYAQYDDDDEWVASEGDRGMPSSRLGMVIYNIEQRERQLKQSLLTKHLNAASRSSPIINAPLVHDKVDNRSGNLYEYDDDDDFFDESEYNRYLALTTENIDEGEDEEEAFVKGVLKYYVYNHKQKSEDDDSDLSDDDSGELQLDPNDPDLQQHVISFDPDRSDSSAARLRGRATASAISAAAAAASTHEDEENAIELSPEMEECIRKLEVKIKSLDEATIKASMIPREIDDELLEVARRRLIDFKLGVPRGLTRRLQRLPNLEKFTDQTIKQRLKFLLEQDTIQDLKVEIEDLQKKLIEAVRGDMQNAWDKRAEKIKREQQKKRRESASSDPQQKTDMEEEEEAQSPVSKQETLGVELSQREKTRLREELNVDEEYIELVNRIKREGNMKVLWAPETEDILVELRKATETWVARKNRFMTMRKLKGERLDKDQEVNTLLRSLRHLWPSQINLVKKLQQIEESQKKKREALAKKEAEIEAAAAAAVESSGSSATAPQIERASKSESSNTQNSSTSSTPTSSSAVTRTTDEESGVNVEKKKKRKRPKSTDGDGKRRLHTEEESTPTKRQRKNVSAPIEVEAHNSGEGPSTPSKMKDTEGKKKNRKMHSVLTISKSPDASSDPSMHELPTVNSLLSPFNISERFSYTPSVIESIQQQQQQQQQQGQQQQQQNSLNFLDQLSQQRK